MNLSQPHIQIPDFLLSFFLWEHFIYWLVLACSDNINKQTTNPNFKMNWWWKVGPGFDLFGLEHFCVCFLCCLVWVGVLKVCLFHPIVENLPKSINIFYMLVCRATIVPLIVTQDALPLQTLPCLCLVSHLPHINCLCRITLKYCSCKQYAPKIYITLKLTWM